MEYITTGEDGNIEIQESGIINVNNINDFRFTFDSRRDITESLNKKDTPQTRTVSVTTTGRRGYAPVTCHYPDGKTSSKLFIDGLVVQYRELAKQEKENYSKTYISVGIPTIIIQKIMADARSESGLTILPKTKSVEQEGCYWVDFSLDNIKQTDIFFIYGDNGDTKMVNTTFNSMLLNTEKCLVCKMLVTLSGSMTNQDLKEPLDLDNGTYFFTIKPTQAYIMDVSDKTGPILTDAIRRKTEKVNQSEALVASDALAKLVLSKMNLK